MAIDSRDERASALQVQMPGVPLFPSPSGSLATAEKRRFMAKFYASGTDALFMGFVDIDAAFVTVSIANAAFVTVCIANASIGTSSAVATLEA